MAIFKRKGLDVKVKCTGEKYYLIEISKGKYSIGYDSMNFPSMKHAVTFAKDWADDLYYKMPFNTEVIYKEKYLKKVSKGLNIHDFMSLR